MENSLSGQAHSAQTAQIIWLYPPMYDPKKAAHIIAYLGLKAQDRCIDMLKAIKLLYIAEREHIRQYGFPMLDEPRAALPHGPANTYTYDRVGGTSFDPTSAFAALLSKDAHNITVKTGIEENDLDELSDAEAQTLDEVWTKLGHLDQWQLVEWTHDQNNVPEWIDPEGSSQPITLEAMLEAAGVENVIEHARMLRRQYAAERALHSNH